jgi:UDP-glucuronate decarboxylase
MTRNERHDRKERDWLHDVNRTNVKERGFSVILVTGGAGFIGRHLCARLLENEKNKVICLDNLVTGSEDNLAEFIDNPRFRFVKFDVKNKMFFPHIDEIYHLACIASPDKYKAFSVETLVTCFEGTKNVLDLAVVHGAKVLFTSTSEVYGDPLEHPQTETYYGNVNCVGERSCYDEGKRVAETLMYEYRRVHGLDVRIARLFNTYGPYMNLEDGRVITNFIRQVKRGEELVIYGSGNQTRSFCYVDDMIHGLLGLMHCHFEPEGALAWGPVNLGNPHCEISLNTLVDVFSLVGVSDLKVRYVEATENDPQRRKPDITKATALFGFIPSVELVDGLKRTFVANLL